MMGLPVQPNVNIPFLKVLNDSGKEMAVAEIARELEHFYPEMTDEDKAQRLASGSLRWRNKVAWVSVSLLRTGDIEHGSSKGIRKITEKGKRRLEEEWPGWIPRYSSRTIEETPPAQIPEEQDEVDPLTTIDNAYNQLKRAVSDELLGRIGKIDPSAFENLVADLLSAMNYGNRRLGTIRVTGRSGDGGIDGECAMDPLGVSKVLFQAKRRTGTIGSGDVRDFIGALETRRVERGVFVTTGSFTQDAKETAKHTGRVMLVDGPRLAELMIQYGIGVSHKDLKIPSVDNDYFEGEG